MNTWQEIKDSWAKRNAEIARLRETTEMTFEEIGNQYGISNARVQAICKKVNHEHNGKNPKRPRPKPKRAP